MKLVLKRERSTANSTIGTLSINGIYECFILEDIIRERPGVPVSQWKIKGATAIPAGTYDIELTMSNRFKRILPLLIGVEGFESIRIHPGNKAVDTEGCLLPGSSRGVDVVYGSVPAFSRLYPQLVEAKARKEHITIEIINTP